MVSSPEKLFSGSDRQPRTIRNVRVSTAGISKYVILSYTYVLGDQAWIKARAAREKLKSQRQWYWIVSPCPISAKLRFRHRIALAPA